MHGYYRISPTFRILGQPRGLLVEHGQSQIFIGQERLTILVDLLSQAQRRMADASGSFIFSKANMILTYDQGTQQVVAKVGVLEPLEWRFEAWELPALLGGLAAFSDEFCAGGKPG
jgi:hypothetical protein